MTKAQQLAEKEYPYVSPKSKSACEYNAQQKRRREGYIKGYNAKQKELEELEDALTVLIARLEYLNETGRININQMETMRDIEIANQLLNKET